MDKQPWELTAAEVLPLLRNGSLKAEDYVRSLLQRIQRRDADVKAWAYLSPSHVLQQAKRLDDLEERGPLHGLPIGIKDVMLTKDMPTQYNSNLFESEEPIKMDANCVVTLRAAGAIIFGKTATTEFATSSRGNVHQNLTMNPHDKTRTPGGSSSGSGAAVADFQVPVSLGTQTGGSIIRPASFNGCYGFKPTWGAISREGLAQWSVTLDTCGFFTRSVADLDILLDLYRIHDDEDIPTTPFNVKGARIGFYKSDYWPKAGPGTQNAFKKAREILVSHGATVEDVQLPEDFKHVLDWHLAVRTREGQASFLGQSLTDKSALDEKIIGLLDNKDKISRKAQLEGYDGCARLRPILDEVARGFDVIITPSVVDEAPADLGFTGDMSFNSIWTIMHVPALNLPGFEGANGMPIGLTAIGPRYGDRRLVWAARTLGPLFEAEGGWQRKNLDGAGQRLASGLRSH